MQQNIKNMVHDQFYHQSDKMHWRKSDSKRNNYLFNVCEENFYQQNKQKKKIPTIYSTLRHNQPNLNQSNASKQNSQYWQNDQAPSFGNNHSHYYLDNDLNEQKIEHQKDQENYNLRDLQDNNQRYQLGLKYELQVVSVIKDKLNYQTMDVVCRLKSQLQCFRRDMLRQVTMLKDYSMKVVFRIVEHYERSIQNYRLDTVSKHYQLNRNTTNPHQLNRSPTNPHLRQNGNKQQKLIIYHPPHYRNPLSPRNGNNSQNVGNKYMDQKHNRVNTQQLQFYKQEKVESNELYLQFQQKSGIKEERKTEGQYLSLLVDENETKTQRARSIQKILETLQKLKNSVQHTDGKLIKPYKFHPYKENEKKDPFRKINSKTSSNR